jgi:hypothetical protein
METDGLLGASRPAPAQGNQYEVKIQEKGNSSLRVQDDPKAGQLDSTHEAGRFD